jgi:hypothetical protein
MIIGSSLTAFSLPIGSSSASGLSGIKLTPQKPAGDAPFSAPSSLSSQSGDPGRALQRGSLLNLSV